MATEGVSSMCHRTFAEICVLLTMREVVRCYANGRAMLRHVPFLHLYAYLHVPVIHIFHAHWSGPPIVGHVSLPLRYVPQNFCRNLCSTAFLILTMREVARCYANGRAMPRHVTFPHVYAYLHVPVIHICHAHWSRPPFVGHVSLSGSSTCNPVCMG